LNIPCNFQGLPICDFGHLQFTSAASNKIEIFLLSGLNLILICNAAG
jgi:hypothetical protein